MCCNSRTFIATCDACRGHPLSPASGPTAPAPNRSPGELLWDGERWLLPEDIPADGLLHSNANPYTEDLLKLQMHTAAEALDLHQAIYAVHSPLRADKWEISLAAHPDPLFRRFIVEGIRHGFQVGFNYAAHPTRVTNQNNMASAYENY